LFKPQISGIGGSVYSTISSYAAERQFMENAYASYSGTSMACPYIAGYVSIYFGKTYPNAFKLMLFDRTFCDNEKQYDFVKKSSSTAQNVSFFFEGLWHSILHKSAIQLQKRSTVIQAMKLVFLHSLKFSTYSNRMLIQ
jgi:hypothetical protein